MTCSQSHIFKFDKHVYYKMLFIKSLEVAEFKQKMSKKRKIDKGQKYINLVSCEGVK